MSETINPICGGVDEFLMVVALCRDSSAAPDDKDDDDDEEEEEGTCEATELTDNAEGTLAWERATAAKKGPKKKKKKSEGAFAWTFTPLWLSLWLQC